MRRRNRTPAGASARSAGRVSRARALACALALACLVVSCRDTADPVVSAAEVRIELRADTFIVGDSLQAAAVVLDKRGRTITMPVTWSTSDRTVITIDARGVVKAVAPGDASVNLTSGSVRASASLRALGMASAQLQPAAGEPGTLVRFSAPGKARSATLRVFLGNRSIPVSALNADTALFLLPDTTPASYPFLAELDAHHRLRGTVQLRAGAPILNPSARIDSLFDQARSVFPPDAPAGMTQTDWTRLRTSWVDSLEAARRNLRNRPLAEQQFLLRVAAAAQSASRSSASPSAAGRCEELEVSLQQQVAAAKKTALLIAALIIVLQPAGLVLFVSFLPTLFQIVGILATALDIASCALDTALELSDASALHETPASVHAAYAGATMTVDSGATASLSLMVEKESMYAGNYQRIPGGPGIAQAIDEIASVFSAANTIAQTLGLPSLPPGPRRVQSITQPQKNHVSVQPSAATWTSSDMGVVRVTSGSIQALQPGAAVITATYGTLTATITINVLAISAVQMVIEPRFAILNVGQSQNFEARLFDRSGNELLGRPIHWSVDTAGVATVSSTGTVLGVAPGTTSVRALYGALSESAPVTVRSPNAAPVIAGFTHVFTNPNSPVCPAHPNHSEFMLSYTDASGDVSAANDPLALDMVDLPNRATPFLAERWAASQDSGNGFSGVLRFGICWSFGPPANTAIELSVALRDMAGNGSNRLTIIVPRPPGAGRVQISDAHVVPARAPVAAKMSR